MNVEVTESYKAYTPPVDIAPIVRSLIRYVPEKCLPGLSRVVLTNSSGLSRQERREQTWSRGRKTHIADAHAYYHKVSTVGPARIEIFVDNVTNSCGPQLLRLPLIRDYIVANTLYHEIGHHIHQTIRPEHTDPETAADRWGAQLTAHFFRRRYWYLALLTYPIFALLNLCKRVVRRR